MWDSHQFLRLALVYLCRLVSFLFAVAALWLAFSRFGSEAPRLYCADILGAQLARHLRFSILVLLACLVYVAAAWLYGSIAWRIGLESKR